MYLTMCIGVIASHPAACLLPWVNTTLLHKNIAVNWQLWSYTVIVAACLQIANYLQSKTNKFNKSSQ